MHHPPSPCVSCLAPQSPASGRGRLAAFPLFLLLLAGAAGAFGQRLLTVVPPDEAPDAPGGRVAAPAAGEWAVEVDHDLVRSDPSRLEFEAPDGRELAVLRTVFEDRGDGNAMWVGRYPGHEYDSVVLTVQDGHLLGHFGLPEGGAWTHSNPLGRTAEAKRGTVPCTAP